MTSSNTPTSQALVEDILEAIDNGRLGVAVKTPDTPVAYAGFDVWENVHTVALVQAIQTLFNQQLNTALQDILDDLPEPKTFLARTMSVEDTKHPEIMELHEADYQNNKLVLGWNEALEACKSIIKGKMVN